MAHVIVLDSLNADLFVCGLCKSVFNSLEVFLSHKKMKCTPTNVKIASAELLDAALANNSTNNTVDLSQKGLFAEPQTETPSNTYTCDLCGKKFRNRKSLVVHTKSHYVKSYQCPVCAKCFMQNSHLQRHILSHKVWPESLSETTPKSSEVELLSYSCPYCKVIFSNYTDFRSHLKNHQAMKKFKCIQGDCVYFFDTLESLLQHVASDHANPLYVCHTCQKPFNSLDSTAAHQHSHNDFAKEDNQGKQYKCLQCDAVFKKPEKLSLHMLTENHNKICIHCNKTFASDKRLRLHLQIHRKIKPYQCNVCNSSFHVKKYLTIHMLKHGNKEFECSICTNMYKRPDLLQRHMKSHQRNNLLKCPYRDALDCKKEFSRTDKLKLHIKSHAKHVAICSSMESQENNVDFNITGSGG